MELEDVAYFEDEDFDGDGNLLISFPKPVVIFMQGDFCGYCKQMKPAYQLFAKKMKSKIIPATICIDGTPSEQKLAARFKNFLAKKNVDYKGVPMVLAYKNGKFLKVYSGDRSERSLIEFARDL